MKYLIRCALAFALVPVLLILATSEKGLACHVSVDGWMTDTEGRPIPGNTFNLVVNKRDIINSTNPGGFFYNIQLSTHDWSLNSLTISALIPPEFSLHGGKPVKVYLNGSQIYNGSNLSYTLHNVPANSVVTMKIHLKYGLIKNPISPPYPQTYTFDATFDTDPVSSILGTAQTTLNGVLR